MSLHPNPPFAALETYTLFKAVYNMRSSIVHGSTQKASSTISSNNKDYDLADLSEILLRELLLLNLTLDIDIEPKSLDALLWKLIDQNYANLEQRKP